MKAAPDVGSKAIHKPLRTFFSLFVVPDTAAHLFPRKELVFFPLSQDVETSKVRNILLWKIGKTFLRLCFIRRREALAHTAI